MAGFRGDVTLRRLGILNLDNLVDIREMSDAMELEFRRNSGIFI